MLSIDRNELAPASIPLRHGPNSQRGRRARPEGTYRTHVQACSAPQQLGDVYMKLQSRRLFTSPYRFPSLRLLVLRDRQVSRWH